MMNNTFLFWVLILVNGVFGADGVKSVSVSVMVGDSVTLHTDDTEIQGVLELVWKIQGENKFIAEIEKEINKLSVPGNDEEPFRGRLKLDDQTGSLTITNLKTTDSRVYELQIKNSRETKSKIFNVDVSGVFSLDGVKKISVRDGDPVPLQTRVTDITGNDVIEWTFGPQNTSIVKTDRVNGRIIYNEDDVRFTNTLHLDIKTGDLTISNTKTDNAGLYHIKII
uniref:Immunoglobulin V-set domain-containing protein n=1 Tax=Cyprinus carpio TaxID=7962 RepID=A0A8C2EGK5_CYPCA